MWNLIRGWFEARKIAAYERGFKWASDRFAAGDPRRYIEEIVHESIDRNGKRTDFDNGALDACLVMPDEPY